VTPGWYLDVYLENYTRLLRWEPVGASCVPSPQHRSTRSTHRCSNPSDPSLFHKRTSASVLQGLHSLPLVSCASSKTSAHISNAAMGRFQTDSVAEQIYRAFTRRIPFTSRWSWSVLSSWRRSIPADEALASLLINQDFLNLLSVLEISEGWIGLPNENPLSTIIICVRKWVNGSVRMGVGMCVQMVADFVDGCWHSNNQGVSRPVTSSRNLSWP
jgi:hypothetical protein